MTYHVKLQKTTRQRRKLSVRKKIYGFSERPRVSVFKSNKHVYAQIIDDEVGKTIASMSDEKLAAKTKKTMSEKAFEVGKVLAAKAISEKVTKVVFDRNGYAYHGRIKNIADGLRDGGLIL